MDKDSSMSNSAVSVGDRLIKRAMIVGMIATGLSVVPTVLGMIWRAGYGVMDAEKLLDISRCVGVCWVVVSVVSFVSFVLLWHRFRTVAIIGIVGIFASIAGFLAVRSGSYNFGNILWILQNLLFVICFSFLSCFVQGWERRFIIGVAGFLVLIVLGDLGLTWCSDLDIAFRDTYYTLSGFLSLILKLVSFFLVLRTCKVCGASKGQGQEDNNSTTRIDAPVYEKIKVSRLLFALGLIAGFVFLKVSGVGANFLEASAGKITNVLGGILLPSILVLAATYFLVGFLASLVDRCIHGRMRRMPFFLSCLCLGGPINIAGVFLSDAAFKRGDLEAQLFVILCAGIVYGLVMFYFWVKRAHDIGWTSKLAIWMLIFCAGPAVGYIYPDLGAFVYVASALPLLMMWDLLLFAPGTQGVNKSGERKDMSAQGRLASLKDLHDKGLMTDLEYEKKRKDILDSI
jgi:hypothetical protein